MYFPDSSRWLSRAVPKEKRNEFVEKVEEMFDKVSGPVVMICGRNKIETASKGREKFVSLSHVSLFVGFSFVIDDKLIVFFLYLFCL